MWATFFNIIYNAGIPALFFINRQARRDRKGFGEGFHLKTITIFLASFAVYRHPRRYFYSTSVSQSLMVLSSSSKELPISTIFFPSALYCAA